MVYFYLGKPKGGPVKYGISSGFLGPVVLRDLSRFSGCRWGNGHDNQEFCQCDTGL
ncbi:hypothetical protein NG798_24610 [Ancylothrix sp. C2]|uniref:hypothetical protein n=1 Tax=Ancylothrix sp. D3o TaxID=2953691 RepID=UPI0021BAD2C9|nr:hypothetical protein [Ancylothrix sp. D3o]MCT7952985.1 hypothetical protein [Ancylothrix sp. D3o]